MEEDDMFDFGFTAVSEEELEELGPVKKLKKDKEDVHERFSKMHAAITRLLENLKTDPEKVYIKWPDRIEKVKAFQRQIDDLYYGD